MRRCLELLVTARARLESTLDSFETIDLDDVYLQEKRIAVVWFSVDVVQMMQVWNRTYMADSAKVICMKH